MCRPIESRDSLGAMGPAAAALFAGYHPSGNNKALPNNGGAMMTNLKSTTASTTGRGASNNVTSLPPWSSGAMLNSSSAGTVFSSADGMNMLSMAPPGLPFVSFPKNLPSMPWMNANTGDLFDLSDEQFVSLDETKPSAVENTQEVEDFEAAELEELLDFSMGTDTDSSAKDKDDLLNLDNGFDGTEMSILYSFLVDASDDQAAAKNPLDLDADDGILNLNVIAGSNPIESLMDSLEGDFTDEELKLTPPPSAPHSDNLLVKTKPTGEVKSRRLCQSEGCYKRSRSNGLCISHGGGRRCAVEGCDKSSQGGNLCIRHGGGKRCSHEGCDKAAQSNFLCKAHGGGPRCHVDGCTRSSQGGGFCRSHGGGKRCMFDGCDKGTQRGDYCALHGGSRLCEVPGCMRNDRGGGLCATHGGGKRCSTEGCNKPCRRKGLCSAHLRQAESK